MPNLYILVGNIASGKSTWVRRKQRKGAIVVNMDSITELVHGEYGFYDNELKSYYHDIESTMIYAALAKGKDVYIDRTNLDRKRRMRFIKIGKEMKARIIYIVFSKILLFEKGLNYLKKDSPVPVSIWNDIAKRNDKLYEEPTPDEGYDEIIKLPELKYQFCAFDFDGIVVENEFPEIGEINDNAVNKIKELWKDDKTRIIIWTCRNGEYLKEMRQFLIKEHIPFDYINENPIINFGSPKIFAHEYYDDRNSNV